MGNVIALVGKTGTGKTSSMLPNKNIGIKGLDPKETVYVSVAGKGKPLMFPKVKEYYKVGTLKEGANLIYQKSANNIATIIKKIDTEPEYKHVKNIVIDDLQFTQMFLTMSKAKEKGWDKWDDIALAAFTPLEAAAAITREDLNVIVTYHPEEMKDGSYKIKTSGGMVDRLITIEAMFTILLYSKSEYDFAEKKPKYYFQTQTDGFIPAKSPAGMFEFQIPNDMGYVLDRIEQYTSE